MRQCRTWRIETRSKRLLMPELNRLSDYDYDNDNDRNAP